MEDPVRYAIRMASTASIWREIIEVARWAPSPHNTQPWQLREIDGERAELYMLSSRRLPDEDTTGCFLLCAMGIFIEAIRIAAANRGRGLVVSRREPLDMSRELIPFAVLTLDGASQPDEFPDKALLGRRTSRLANLPGPLPEIDQSISEIARRYGHMAAIYSQPGTVKRVMDANAEAVMHDLADPTYGGEIRTWYRYTRAHAAKTRDGLDARCMNVPGYEMWLSARCPWLLRFPLSRPLITRLLQRRAGRVGALLAISGVFFDSIAAERAGAMLLRLWLKLHELGVGIHPFGNLVTNDAAHRRLTELLGVDNVWLVARLGRTEIPPRSHRLETREVLLAT